MKTPLRAPRANSFAERWVRTVRAECLDWTLIWNRRHLERVLTVYIQHYNTARPHRGTNLNVPIEATPITDPTAPIERIDLLGGLIHEYRRRPDPRGLRLTVLSNLTTPVSSAMESEAESPAE